MASTLLIFRLLFSGVEPSLALSKSTNFQDGINFKILENESFGYQEDSAQAEQIMKASDIILKIPYAGEGNSSPPSKFTTGSKAKGAAKKNFSRPQTVTNTKPTSGRSGGSLFAEAFTFEANFSTRPGENSRDGLFN